MILKGLHQYKLFQEGKPLTRKGAILAQCYVCNGAEEGGEDCLGGEACPLYQFFQYRGKKRVENAGFKGGRNKEKDDLGHLSDDFNVQN
ncbi:MAG: hypothetical protein KJ661_05960 [Candidatus Omnitrophica bacterium]|nr:hypothetical protein [Candidatus Omnitrophota bacterium]